MPLLKTEKIASNVFGLSYAVAHCSEPTTIPDITNDILVNGPHLLAGNSPKLSGSSRTKVGFIQFPNFLNLNQHATRSPYYL